MRTTTLLLTFILITSITASANGGFERIPLAGGSLTVPKGNWNLATTPLAYLAAESSTPADDYVTFGNCRVDPSPAFSSVIVDGIAVYVQHIDQPPDVAPGTYPLRYHHASGSVDVAAVTFEPDSDAARTGGGANHEHLRWFYLVNVSAECLDGVAQLKPVLWLPVVVR